jgi:hypothetical protein
MNGEYVCEMVRAHYDGDETRFGTILAQLISSETRRGNHGVADRLRQLSQGVG